MHGHIPVTKYGHIPEDGREDVSNQPHNKGRRARPKAQKGWGRRPYFRICPLVGGTMLEEEMNDGLKPYSPLQNQRKNEVAGCKHVVFWKDERINFLQP